MPTPNSISFEVTDEAMAAYRDLKPGDAGSCKNIEFTTVTNDGNIVTGTIDAIEPSDYAESEVEEAVEKPASPMMVKGSKPMAMRAMKMSEEAE